MGRGGIGAAPLTGAARMHLREQLAAGLVGRYTIDRQLGEGGMAVVFLATDLKHEREVAVKVLRPELSAVVGAERFLREIHVTAHLQHPHILPLYDSGAVGDLLFYVMPLVQGESLRDRLVRERQLPVDQSIAITQAIAGALDYAHRHGVLHRDIKPENILLHDSQPMLADFGIALAVSAAAGVRLTHTGITVGTPSYMSPEQVGNEHLDARSDIYALGCVAYEMLAGEPPFDGPTAQAVVAAVMTEEAPPLAQRRRTVPAGAAAAIHRALERLPADRFASAAEFAAALSAERHAAPRPAARRAGMPIAVALGLAATLAIGWLAGRIATPAARPGLRRWNVDLPPDAPVALAGPTTVSGWQTAIALSPNADRLAYTTPRGATTMLAVRALDGDSVTVLPGTEGAYHPFFSPDGAWIGFFSGNLLRKVPATGGSPVTVAPVDRITGAVWASADRIVVCERDGFDVHLISPSGARADSTIHVQTEFGTPDVLPGGDWIVGQLNQGQLALLSLTRGTEVTVTRRGVLPLDSARQADFVYGASPRFVSSGQLVYAAGDGVLMALPFDGRRRAVRGEPRPVLSGVRMEAGYGFGEFALSASGTLVYVPGGNQYYVQPAFVTPAGRVDTLPFPRAPYTQPRISPDGKWIATHTTTAIGTGQVLLLNPATGVRQQLDVQSDALAYPASWLPSGHELLLGLWDPLYGVMRSARIQSLDTGRWRELRISSASLMTVSPDGRTLVFSRWGSGDLYLRALGDDTATTRVPGHGFGASFAPNGRWLAWGDFGTGAVNVSPVPPTGAVYTVVEHGEKPLWTPRGDAIIFRSGSRYYRVPVTTAGGFHASRPQLLVEGPFLSTYEWNHDIGPDGRLLVLLASAQRAASTLGVITAFPDMIRSAGR